MDTKDRWTHCDGVPWECPIDGLNWCTECDPICDSCGTDKPTTNQEGTK